MLHTKNAVVSSDTEEEKTEPTSAELIANEGLDRNTNADHA